MLKATKKVYASWRKVCIDWNRHQDYITKSLIFLQRIMVLARYCLFVKKLGDNNFIILFLYVDDMLIVDHDASKIDNLKKKLSKSFIIKDQGSTIYILGMTISYDWKIGKLWLSQEAFIESALERINMSKAKYVCSPLAGHLRLSSKHFPTSEKEKQQMKGLFYASTLRRLMYAMACTNYCTCSWCTQSVSL